MEMGTVAATLLHGWEQRWRMDSKPILYQTSFAEALSSLPVQ